MKTGPAPLPLFDRLSKISEAHYPELVKILKRAKLFLFDGKPQDVLPTEVPVEESALLMDNFFLPFPTIAIEDNATCTVLFDSVEGQTGFDKPRHYVDICPVFTDVTAFSATQEQLEANLEAQQKMRDSGIPRDASVVSVGTLDRLVVDPENPKVMGVHGGLAVTFMATKHALLSPIRTDIKDEGFIKAALTHAKTACEEVLYFNTPSRFICERKPKQDKKSAKLKHGQVVRSYNQSVFTAITPAVIREKFGLAESAESGTKTSHWRRRHKRLLTSERYANMQGKTVTVKAHWVGPDEATHKGRAWKIRTDL